MFQAKLADFITIQVKIVLEWGGGEGVSVQGEEAGTEGLTVASRDSPGS